MRNGSGPEQIDASIGNEAAAAVALDMAVMALKRAERHLRQLDRAAYSVGAPTSDEEGWGLVKPSDGRHRVVNAL